MAALYADENVALELVLNLRRLIRAGGAVGIFVLVYSINPPRLDADGVTDLHLNGEWDFYLVVKDKDIKGGTAMMWLVLAALKEQAPKVFEDINWKLLWNSSEERYSPDFGGRRRGRLL